ncbi:unnamed protein product [Ceutorhynchus assimilis]|uniref:Uncharacterized protein n=1 Tax=Ceutorhynchus assimilis TaxID=467358 RepID=A0A9N9MXD1_9CUCU|nr:unnamed protein product [Ceutorhynchus assimilis]
MEDLSNCLKVPPSDFICSKTTTYLIKERPICEVELKTKQLQIIPKDCDTKVTKGTFEILASNKYQPMAIYSH